MDTARKHPENDTRYRYLWTILKLIFGLALVVVVVRGVQWQQLRESWRAIWWVPFGLAIGFRFVVIAARAWRWAVLLRHTPFCPTVGQLTRVLVKAELFNSLMPSTAGGDIYRVVATRTTCDTPSATAAVLADRAMGMIALVVSALVALVINPGIRQSYVGQVVLGVALMAILGVGVLWAVRSPIGRWLKTHAQPDDSDGKKLLVEHILEYARALAGYTRRPWQLALALVLSVLPLAGVVVSTYLLCLSVGAVLAALDLVTIALTVSVVALLPIFVGGLGGQEAAFIFMFQQVGVALSEALLIALLGRALVVAFAALAGLLYMYDSSRTTGESPTIKLN